MLKRLLVAAVLVGGCSAPAFPQMPPQAPPQMVAPYNPPGAMQAAEAQGIAANEQALEENRKAREANAPKPEAPAPEPSEGDGVALALCQATWGLETARGAIRHERGNPGGVVNLATLHTAGEGVQYYQTQVELLRPRYAALRGHAFKGWQSEPVCVQAANEP